MDIAKTGKKYHSGGDFVYSCQYHVIWCPKYRRKVLVEPIANKLKELVKSKQTEYGYIVEEVEVMPDHVHMILDVNPKDGGIYRVVSKIKGYTSHELRNEFPELKTKLPTLWTNSRFISTVGSVTLEIVKAYIENQKKV